MYIMLNKEGTQNDDLHKTPAPSTHLNRICSPIYLKSLKKPLAPMLDLIPVIEQHIAELLAQPLPTATIIELDNYRAKLRIMKERPFLLSMWLLTWHAQPRHGYRA
jgi:hypothetical protein